MKNNKNKVDGMSNKFFKENSDKLLSRYPRPDDQDLIAPQRGTNAGSPKDHGTRSKSWSILLTTIQIKSLVNSDSGKRKY